ncbi:helix-turn-helix transcriptional regulator [Leptolyngbya sp. FACHB-261]|uniref:ArsR/SmtB family transcription factor n=1 Tax=Leptolyngbya sp. FACHB-261 TaxID=2692806 RepID=UPI00168702C6|nr:helix-turn-helix domain-containing protein [Leptolyngbya sp. FACHB-261]MBD2099645.1 helix-turn-helix transcriptional regulator [Leptolyngbya sp. FACHB-261]
MRLLFHPAREDISLAAVLYALSDPCRIKIVRALATGGEEQPCGSFGIPIAKSTLSHHFKVLREAGILHTRTEGREHLNSLRRQDLDARFPGLLDAVMQASEPL